LNSALDSFELSKIIPRVIEVLRFLIELLRQTETPRPPYEGNAPFLDGKLLMR
jgi:hypothetical protein